MPDPIAVNPAPLMTTGQKVRMAVALEVMRLNSIEDAAGIIAIAAPIADFIVGKQVLAENLDQSDFAQCVQQERLTTRSAPPGWDVRDGLAEKPDPKSDDNEPEEPLPGVSR